MSKNHELSRKEMKGPDQFQMAAAKVADWIAAHEKQMVAGVVAALGIAAVAVGISSWQSHQAARAGAELTKVIDRIQGDISAAPLPGSSRPTFQSDEERQRAIATAAAEVRTRFSTSDAAATATLVSGDAHLRLGEWDQAEADYQAALSSAKGVGSLRFVALDGIARAYEGKGDLAKALQSWERFGTEASFYKDRVEIERARVLVKMGRMDDAKKILAGFDEESLLKSEAHKRLAKLGGM